MDELAEKIEEELEEFVYSSQGESLEQIVLYYLGMHAATLAVAESCTGGLVAERLTSIHGSSRSFLGGAVVYSDELKSLFAGVAPSLIEEHGAVSKEVAGLWRRGFGGIRPQPSASASPALPVPAVARKRSPSVWFMSRCRWQGD